MRKFYLIVFMAICSLFSAQTSEFSVDMKGNVAFPMGNNFMADGLKTFTGFGFGFNAIFFHHFGVGLEFNQFYSQVKDESVFGNLHSPTLTDFSLSLLYNRPLQNNFNIEGQLGFGSLPLKSKSIYRPDGFRENASSVILGAKLLYNITDNRKVQVFINPKFYFYSSVVEIDNPTIQDYYSKSTIFNLSLGLRFLF